MIRHLLFICLLFRAPYAWSQHFNWSPLGAEEKRLSIQQNLRYESDSPDSLILYRGYVVSYNRQWKIPNWTAYELVPEELDNQKAKAKRQSRFYQDINVPREIQADHSDFENSGFDRGHMTPAGDQSWNKQLKDETFLITNVAPQSPDLNQGLWEQLESGIRSFVKDSAATCYIITGTIMESERGRGLSKSKIGIPSSFYKIVFSHLRGRDFIYCFLIPHQFSYKGRSLQDYQVSLKELETKTGSIFFEKLHTKKDVESLKMLPAPLHINGR